MVSSQILTSSGIDNTEYCVGDSQSSSQSGQLVPMWLWGGIYLDTRTRESLRAEKPIRTLSTRL
jgi:hypothetical protein